MAKPTKKAHKTSNSRAATTDANTLCDGIAEDSVRLEALKRDTGRGLSLVEVVDGCHCDTSVSQKLAKGTQWARELGDALGTVICWKVLGSAKGMSGPKQIDALVQNMIAMRHPLVALFRVFKVEDRLACPSIFIHPRT